MKKIILILLVILVLMSLTTCQTLQSVMQEPLVSLLSVELDNINFNGARLLCKVQVENPNAFDIPFPETDWQFFINANSFVSGTVKNNQRIRSRGKTTVEVPINLDYLEIFNTFRSLRGSRETAYKVALGVKFLIPVLGEKVWEFDHNGSLPIPQLPRIAAPTMRVDSINTSRAEVLVTVNVENPNPFPIPSPTLTYDYSLNRNSFIKGNINEEGLLAASSTTPINFRLLVTFADLFRSFASLITAREVASSLSVTCDLNMPVFSGETMQFNVAGTLPLRP